MFEEKKEVNMKVLVACEESQVVTIAFRERGHTAFSCDIKECSGGHPEWHIKGDCVPVIEHNSWDLIIAHPPCTYLAVSGACNMYKNGIIDRSRYDKMIQARDFFMYFYNLTGVRVCIENPRAMRLADLPQYSQVIQPFQFGDNYTKQTLLWLKDLPYLIGDCVGIGKRKSVGCKSWCDIHRNATQRSKTFTGIARAMAKQWGDL